MRCFTRRNISRSCTERSAIHVASFVWPPMFSRATRASGTQPDPALAILKPSAMSSTVQMLPTALNAQNGQTRGITTSATHLLQGIGCLGDFTAAAGAVNATVSSQAPGIFNTAPVGEGSGRAGARPQEGAALLEGPQQSVGPVFCARERALTSLFGSRGMDAARRQLPPGGGSHTVSNLQTSVRLLTAASSRRAAPAPRPPGFTTEERREKLSKRRPGNCPGRHTLTLNHNSTGTPAEYFRSSIDIAACRCARIHIGEVG